tara:strand:+ start:376 stop:996 length:621 start_codon:yes stop_codon:yes gene_type:complete
LRNFQSDVATSLPEPWKEKHKQCYVTSIYPDHKEVNPSLYELIRTHATKELTSGAMQTAYQSGSDNRNIYEIKKLFSAIEHILPQAADELALNTGSNYHANEDDSKVFKISQYWGMYYLDGGGAVEHNHFPFPLSFAYYINTPEGSAPFTIEGQDIPVNAGRIIIFPGSAFHSVHPSVEGRCMISGNVTYRPKFKKVGFQINKGFG